MRIGKLLSAGMLLVMVTVPTGFAQIPRLISYQGRLTDANGRAISDTTTFTFTFYRCAATSTPLWSESQQVLVQDGIFNVSLGQIVPLELSFDEPYCLGITVNGGLEMQPLIPLNAVAYSMRSLYADSLAAGAVTGDKIQTGTVVRSVNTLTDHVTLQAGENITITSTGDTLRISAKVDAGPGDIKLPYSGMVTSSTPAFSLTNTGDGLAGEFISDNPGSTLGMRISASGSGHALYAFNKGTGHAAYFNITNLTSTSTTLEAINDALGKAASFSIANADNTSPALECRTEGQGPAFVAHQEGPSSRIAEFKGDGAVRAYINKAGDLVTAGNISFTSIPQILLSGSSSAPLKLEMSGTGEADLFVEGKIGIGISAPSEKLHVAGMIYSTSGGFKFPDGTVQTTAARNSSADISAISAGNGLTGGGLSGDINLDVGAGLGISVTADAVSLNTSYTDGLYINEGQANSVTGAMILDGTVQTTDLAFIPPDGYSLDAADGSPANAVYVDNGGNVGIGTTSPGSKLHLSGGDFFLENGLGIYWKTSSGSFARLFTLTGSNQTIVGSNGLGGGLQLLSGDDIDLMSGTATLMHLEKTNNYVGIGTNSPSQRLDIAGMAQMTGFKMPPGAAPGYVLTADANGIGSWQAVPASSGDITAVGAGAGLTGGGLSGDSNLDVGAGAGILVSADAVSLNTSFTDGLYVNEGQNASITNTMIQDNAINSAKIENGSIAGQDILSSTTISVKKLEGGRSSSVAAGLYGYASGYGYGVYGENSSGNGGAIGYANYGASGWSSTGTGIGGSASSSGTGVSGTSNSGRGVYGSSNTGTAVYGEKTGGGDYAGYFSGNVNITGILTKGGGAFKIDHPLDPENRYLQHSFVESPDMMNIYNGIVTLDENGEAWVDLPDYLEALNKDFRYQLTCLGSYAPVYVAVKINGNRFKIGGGTAKLEVSWQVTGIRNDAFAQAHRIVPEVDKKASDRGKYLYPRESGKTEELGIDHVEQ